MYLGNIEGFDNTNDLHSSDTFQRALLNDCLFDITKKFNIDINPYLEKENLYLIQRTNNDSIGAWCYFPTVQEIATDIDDLGQIIQQFIRSRRSDLVVQYCIKPINISILDKTLQNGGIETWIIPKYNLSEKQQKQKLFNSTKWGKGPDVEVVANFAYSLALFDFNKYKPNIDGAIHYILSQLKEQGYWESRWYYANFMALIYVYDYFVCLKTHILIQSSLLHLF